MLRLIIVTCLALGTTLAKPPPEAKPFDVEPIPFQDNPEPVAHGDKPDPILFQEGERTTYTLAPGRYYFTSPNYPSAYPNNHDSSFTIKGDNNQAISITCNPFRMESHSSCGWDYLSINDRKYCGTTAPPTTTVSELRIRIHTDYSVTAPGFYCLVTIASGGCNCGLRQTRVVGGSDATAGQFPWQAGLVLRGGTRTFCGGSVINKRYVLTAAHCLENFSAASQIQVTLGDLNIGPTDAGEQRYFVQQIIQHPQYSSVGTGWDFSLLKLDREITFSNTIIPVCLPTAGQTYAGATAIASGYGQVGTDLDQATTLQHVEVPVWSQSSCATKWSPWLTSSMICAGGYPEGGRGICQGDSGGPLVTNVSGRFRLIGVTSFTSDGCALTGLPEVYARVTEALTWISSNTADVATCTP